MRTAGELSRDDWDRLLQAPFCAYGMVTTGGATEADARCLREEVGRGPGSFVQGTVGHMLMVALADNLDTLWAAHIAGGGDPRKGIERAMKVLRDCDPGEQVAVRAWLLGLAVRVAQATRVVGEPAVSATEAAAITDLAGLLRMPIPDLESDQRAG